MEKKELNSVQKENATLGVAEEKRLLRKVEPSKHHNQGGQKNETAV